MIIDRLANSHLYAGLSPRIERAFQYLQQTDLQTIEVGKYEIDGKNLFALVQQYSTKPKAQGKWEAHRRYIDVQYIVQGREQIAYAHLSRLTQGEYDAVKDFLPLSGEGDYLTLSSGDFMLLYPEDGHKPGLALADPSVVKKVVVKVAVE
jgi:YhcH/YjgK/YiaL family protein